MRVAGRKALTIAEAMVAVMVLSVGVLAVVGSAALTSRMLGRGRHATRVGQVAAARIERLRQVALSTVPACSGAEWRSGSEGSPGLTESWQILDPAGTRPARAHRAALPTSHRAHHRHRRHRHALRPAMSARRGFTLVELAVALVLGLLVGGHRPPDAAPGPAPRPGAVRAAGPERERARGGAGAGGRAGRHRVRRDHSRSLGRPRLRGSRPERSPRRRARRRHLSRRAGRGIRVRCRFPARRLEIVVAESSWESPRAPRATDSLLVFAESDPATGSDDAWIHLGIVSVGAGSCPGGAAGVAVQVAVPAPLDPAALARVTSGSPARLAEVMQMRYYRVGRQVLVRHAVGVHRRGDHPRRRAPRRQHRRASAASRWPIATPPTARPRIPRRCGPSRSPCSASPARRFTAVSRAARWWIASLSPPGSRPATRFARDRARSGEWRCRSRCLALVLIAAIVAAGFASAHLEQRIGRNTVYAVQAAGAAEAGAAAVVGGWEGYGLGLLAPGDSAVLPTVPLPGLAAYSPTVARLNGSCSWCGSPGCAATRMAGRWRGGKSGSWSAWPTAPLPARRRSGRSATGHGSSDRDCTPATGAGGGSASRETACEREDGGRYIACSRPVGPELTPHGPST